MSYFLYILYILISYINISIYTLRCSILALYYHPNALSLGYSVYYAAGQLRRAMPRAPPCRAVSPPCSVIYSRAPQNSSRGGAALYTYIHICTRLGGAMLLYIV